MLVGARPGVKKGSRLGKGVEPGVIRLIGRLWWTGSEVGIASKAEYQMAATRYIRGILSRERVIARKLSFVPF